MLSCTPAFFKLNSWLLWSFVGWTCLGSPFNRIMNLSEGFKLVPIDQGHCFEVACSHPASVHLNMGGNTSCGSPMSMGPSCWCG